MCCSCRENDPNCMPITFTGAAPQDADADDGPLAPLGPTAFFSVHLDAKSEAQRVGQLEKCLEAARSFGTREVVIAGDLNTEAGYGVT